MRSRPKRRALLLLGGEERATPHAVILVERLTLEEEEEIDELAYTRYAQGLEAIAFHRVRNARGVRRLLRRLNGGQS